MKIIGRYYAWREYPTLLFKLRMIYYKYFGKKCECGAKLYGGDFCMDMNHDDNIKINSRDNKLKEIGINE